MTSSVGKETLAYCTRCKMDLTHTIASMIGDRIARVHCKTCRSDHNYRAPKGVTEPGAEGTASSAIRGTRSAPRERVAAVPVSVAWQTKMSQFKDRPIQVYSAKSKYQMGDRIKHPTFGDGVVEKTIFPNKVEIIFESDIKVLIHAPA